MRRRTGISTKKRKTEKDRRNEAKSEANRSEAAQLQCSRNDQKGVGVVCCAHDNTVQRRQANSNRLGVLGDSNMRVGRQPGIREVASVSWTGVHGVDDPRPSRASSWGDEPTPT